MRTMLLLAALGLTGCDDTLFGVPRPGTETPLEGGFCGVRSVVSSPRCAGCHSAAAPDGGLDLETDPHAALVDQAATIDATLVRVRPGDPDGSFLMAKLEGRLDADQGGSMPPGASLDADTLQVFRQWIADGASSDCSTEDTDPPLTYYYPHPEGWEAPDAHGLAFKLRDPAYGDWCTTCHGEDLSGGTGPSCDSCHTGGDAWRTDCVFCHGGTEDRSGAPPRDIDNATTDLTFPAHQAHVQEGPLHGGWTCAECHTTPSDVLSPGHTFVEDSTPGVAEVVFDAGRSDVATWTVRTGTCSDLYCHGNGQGDNGSVALGAGPLDCGSCHASRASGEDALKDMSGRHDDHVWDEGLGCQECHGATTADGNTILDKALHIDGRVDLQLPDGMTRSGETCSGSCHGETHYNEDWD